MIWFIVFHPKRPDQWWARTYGHVSLAGFEKETWLHLDLHRGGVEAVVAHEYDDVNDVLSFLTAHKTLVRAPESQQARHFFRPMTCVAFAKHTLGLRSRALLPDALFRSLVHDQGAEIMNEEQPPQRDGGTAAAAGACRAG